MKTNWKRGMAALSVAALMTASLLPLEAGAAVVNGPRVYNHYFGGNVKPDVPYTTLGIVMFPGDQLKDLSNTTEETRNGATYKGYYMGFDTSSVDPALCTYSVRTEEVATDTGKTETFTGIAGLTITGDAPVVVDGIAGEDGIKRSGPYQIMSNNVLVEHNTVLLRRIKMRTLTPYLVTYDLAGGSWKGGNNPNSTSFKQDRADQSIQLTNPVREGYRFCGWREDSRSTALEVKGLNELVVRGLSDDDPETAQGLLNQCNSALNNGYTLTAQWQEGDESQDADETPDDSAPKPSNPFAPPAQVFRTWNAKKDQSFQLKVKTVDGAVLSYASTKPKKVAVNKKTGKVTIKKGFKGTVDIVCTASATEHYDKSVKKIRLMVGPGATRLSSVSGGKGVLSAKWKKNTTGKGYELQISTKKSFSKLTKTVKVKKSSAVTAKVKKLKKGTYYVRVRTILDKTCSDWSKVKKVKVS